MKQQITKKQWDELTGSQQFEFIENITFPKIHGIKIDSCDNLMEIWGRKKPIQLPNIGQIIEYLENAEEITCYGKWAVVMNDLTCFRRKELCDSLWDAVKDKLRNNK